jgi:hypothetical protein
MRIKEAKEIRDKFFRKLVTSNIHDEKPSVTDAIIVPVHIHRQDPYLLFVDSPSIFEQGIMMGISKDDRAVGAMGIGMDDDEWTIMIKIYDARNEGSESEWIFAKDCPSIKDQIPKDVWNNL